MTVKKDLGLSKRERQKQRNKPQKETTVEPNEYVLSVIRANGDGKPIRKTLNISHVPSSARCKPLQTSLQEKKQRFLNTLESLPQKVTAPPKSFFERQLEEIAKRLAEKRETQKQHLVAPEKKKRGRPAKKVVLSPEETKALELATRAAERVMEAIEAHEIENDMDIGLAVRREGETLIVGTGVRTVPLAKKTQDIRALELILQPVVLNPHAQDCMAVIRHTPGFTPEQAKGKGLQSTLDAFVDTVKRETKKLPRLYKDEPNL